MADKFEKLVAGIVVLAVLVVILLLAVGAWGFIQIIFWLTSK